MTDFTALRTAMVDCQVRPSDVTRYGLIDAMLSVPRERFVPKARRELAYAESDLEIGDGRALLAPRTLAKMIEVADVGAEDLVLDLAPGTGYSTAVLSRLAAAVVAIEADAAMAEHAAQVLTELEADNAVVTAGVPAEGDVDHGPYDVIFINGAVETIPDALLAQLKDNGRLVAVFRDGAIGQCRVLVRAGEAIAARYEFDATAPLIGGFEAAREFAF